MMMDDVDCASWSGILETISPCDQKIQNDWSNLEHENMKQFDAIIYSADLRAIVRTG